MTDQPPTSPMKKLPAPAGDWIVKAIQFSVIGSLFAFFLWLLDDWVAAHFELMKILAEKIP